MGVDNFLTEFESFQGELKTLILRITASVQDAEDIVQDTYIKASSKIDTFRNESSLKTWVFSIASNLARDLLRARQRWPENVTYLSREAALGNPEFHTTLSLRREYGKENQRQPVEIADAPADLRV